MKRLMILTAMMAVVAFSVACGGTGTTNVSSLELAARETSVAQATRNSMDGEARATSQALSNEAQATRQRQDAESVAMAQAATSTAIVRDAQATATADMWSVQATGTAEAVQVQATAQAQENQATAQAQVVQATNQALQANATQIAWSFKATAQAQAILDSAQATAVQATTEHTIRQNQAEKVLQPIRMTGWVAFTLAGLALFLWSGLQLVAVLKTRFSAIHRDERGDPPLLAIASPFGKLVVLDPLRLWGGATVVDGEVTQPLLTHPELQDGVTKRSQFVDWMKGGRPTPPILHPGRQPVLQPRLQGEWTAERPIPQWPTRVPLSGILDNPPSVRDLILGVTIREDGQSEIVKADMGRLVHVAVGGSSGWGKSMFLRALAFQLAQSVEPVDLALVDLEGTTFSPFCECDRLLYPVADTEGDALAIFSELIAEMNRRKGLFADFPGVDGLYTYNARSDIPLPPIVTLIDEATALLADKDVENAVRTLVLRARKYGVWCVLGGQDWKASSLDTAIRNQLATRVQFKAMDASQSRVLLQRNGAEHLGVAGRALAIIPGREMLKLQAPIIGYEDIATATRNGGPQGDMPVTQKIEDNQVARIRELAERGTSKRQIALEVFGYAGGKAHQSVTEALQGSTTTTQMPVQASSTTV